MIAVVAPEPVSWLEPLVEVASAYGSVVVLAPWATPPVLAQLSARLPTRVAMFVKRRALPSDHDVVTLPGWSVAEGVLRAWVQGRADRHLRARFAVRRAADAWAARWLASAQARGARDVKVVFVPGLAAERTLAQAASMGARTFLIEDMPCIRGLHCDLDRAARRHPECRFLRRFRAPDRVLVRQQVERALADHLIVRGAYARASRIDDGIDDRCIVDMPNRTEYGLDRDIDRVAHRRQRAQRSGRTRILLAGLAAARHGTVEALAVVEARPWIDLFVRAGEGLEPAGLLNRSRIHPATREQRADLSGIDVVISPALCETYPRELERAAALGVPIVCTRRSAGFVQPERVIPPGDADALGRAIDEIVHAGISIPGDDRCTRMPAHALTRVLDHVLSARA